MSQKDIDDIIGRANIIVAGYAFTIKEDGNILVVGLSDPYHAAVIDRDGNLIETNMYDLELDIVLNKYWNNNKDLLLDQQYA